MRQTLSRTREAASEDRSGSTPAARPERYAPQFGNFCAMAPSKGELVEAAPENWLISDGKLCVFGKPVGSDLFRKDLAANVTEANQNRTLLPTR